MLKNQYRRRWDEMLLIGLCTFIVYAITLVFCCVIDQGKTELIIRLPMGIFMGYIAGLIMHLIYCTYTTTSEFNLAVSMSVTRKKFLQSYLAFSVLELLGLFVEVLVLGIIEKLIYGMVLDRATIIWKPIYGMLFIYLVLINLGVIACETLLAACAMRYGWKVMWGLIAVIALFPTKDLVKLHILSENAILSFYQVAWSGEQTANLYTGIGIVEAVVLLLTILLTGYHMLMRQRVTY